MTLLTVLASSGSAQNKYLGNDVRIEGIMTRAPLAQIDHADWFYHDPPDKGFNCGPQFNYEHLDERRQVYPARRFIGDSMRYRVREYHLDGIRDDAAAQRDMGDPLSEERVQTNQQNLTMDLPARAGRVLARN
ncbi:MAG: hypothetical protein ACKV2V_31070 [Blastocatellia bacterium]